MEVAKKCKDLKDFRENYPGAYAKYCKDKQIKESLGLHTRKRSWTKEEISQIASQCKSITEFIKVNKNAYATAYNKGWLDEICSHMYRRSRKIKV